MTNSWSDWSQAAEVLTFDRDSVAADESGVCGRLALKLPDFERGVYYRAFHKYAEKPLSDEDWINGANRLQAKEFSSLEGLADGGLMLTLKLADGSYMTLLPLVSSRTMSWFSFEDSQLFVKLGNLADTQAAVDNELPASMPLLAYAISDNIYAANYEAWRIGLSHELVGRTAKLRSDKRFPDIFRYIGWCSWEEFYFTIDEQKIIEIIDQLDVSPVPIQYLLIDDGHQHHERNEQLASMNLNTTLFDGMQHSRLISFDSNARFPSGWTPIITRMKSSKMKWIGLWLNFNGYWGGIHPDNQLGLGEALAALRDGEHEFMLPSNDYYASYRFYNAYTESQRTAGFDFLKIDNQSANLLKYRRGGGESPVHNAVNNAQALEAASAHHMETHMNCMAHNAVAIFNTRNSAVTRCSEDYKKGDLLWAKRHVHNSFANIPVLGHTVWGDHDMFHSNDPAAAEVMSITKALSGGPVYLSDTPDNFDVEVINPLIYTDGELLRPLAPAAPLPDSIMDDPVTSDIAYGVIAPLINKSTAIGLFNLTEPCVTVSRSITVSDYRWSGAMLQPVEQWETPEEGLVLYDWRNKEAYWMTGGTAPVTFTLTAFSYQLLLMCPVRHGWAVIGHVGKYLSTAAAPIYYSDRNQLVIGIREPGPYLIWHADGQLACSSGSISHYRANMWVLEVGLDSNEERITIIRESIS